MKQAGAGNTAVLHCCGDCCRGKQQRCGCWNRETEKYKENKLKKWVKNGREREILSGWGLAEHNG